MDTEHSAITTPARRIEVFAGAGRRRAWSVETKARIVAEIATSGESVCAVARRHGLSPQQLFGWRRQLRAAEDPATERLQFVPAVADATSLSAPAICASRSEAEPAAGLIEIELDGAKVRVGSGADAKLVIAVLRTLKAAP